MSLLAAVLAAAALVATAGIVVAARRRLWPAAAALTVIGACALAQLTAELTGRGPWWLWWACTLTEVAAAYTYAEHVRHTLRHHR